MITEQQLDDLLANKRTLLRLVPSHAYDQTHYKLLSDKYPMWYQIVMSLSVNLSGSKKRAKQFDWKCDLSLAYLATLWMNQRGRCALTGQPLDYASGSQTDKNPYRASVDRIDNNKGYVVGNVRLLTHWANNAKSTWPDDVFEKFVKTANNTLVEHAQRKS